MWFLFAASTNIQQWLRTQLSRLGSNHLFIKGLSAFGVGISLLLLRIAVKKIIGKIYKYPPQLYGLPMIGSLATLILWKDEHFNSELLPIYGDIVKYHIGSMTLYKINDVELLRKVYAKAKDRVEIVCINL